MLKCEKILYEGALTAAACKSLFVALRVHINMNGFESYENLKILLSKSNWYPKVCRSF